MVDHLSSFSFWSAQTLHFLIYQHTISGLFQSLGVYAFNSLITKIKDTSTYLKVPGDIAITSSAFESQKINNLFAAVIKE